MNTLAAWNLCIYSSTSEFSQFFKFFLPWWSRVTASYYLHHPPFSTLLHRSLFLYHHDPQASVSCLLVCFLLVYQLPFPILLDRVLWFVWEALTAHDPTVYRLKFSSLAGRLLGMRTQRLARERVVLTGLGRDRRQSRSERNTSGGRSRVMYDNSVSIFSGCCSM